MRRVTISEYASLDGVMKEPDTWSDETAMTRAE
jgi:hypothetical protein